MHKLNIPDSTPAPEPGPANPDAGWRRARIAPSLSEVYRTVDVNKATTFRKMLAFAGPGYLVAVGYMDPGNWATDLAGGSRFGYTLLSVILLSNLMAVLLQGLACKLGIVTGRDLAQACRDHYSPRVSFGLWVMCEIAIGACDLAEVIGSAIALNLLFGLSLPVGIGLTALDVLIVLYLQNKGFRLLEALVIALVAVVGGCFLFELIISRPDLGAVAKGFIPTTEILRNQEMLYIGIGILGATVMPHNLYLHSSIVQTRNYGRTRQDLKTAIGHNTFDTIFALGCAFFVNAAILVLAASVFWKSGVEVSELQQAHELLKPALGGAAATLFAVALLCSGQSSTITGTLAGQIVMEGFLRIRIKPWLRRMITRLIAIVPALAIVSATGGRDTVQLLVLSQVVLSMQLPFAIFPLMMMTSDKARMGEFANLWPIKVLGYGVCIIIASLNVYLLWSTIGPLWVGVIAAVMGAFAAWIRLGYQPRPAI